MTRGVRNAVRTCAVPDCGGAYYARGYCNKHWARWRKHGDPSVSYREIPPEERFWPKVNRDGPIPAFAPHLGPCWIWTAASIKTQTEGVRYGAFSIGGGPKLAHRVSYEFAKGPILDGLEVDHLCRITLCVNPNHLEAVTGRENVLRSSSPAAESAARTHCNRGHPYDPENTRVYRGARRCKRCEKERDKKRTRKSRRKSADAATLDSIL